MRTKLITLALAIVTVAFAAFPTGAQNQYTRELLEEMVRVMDSNCPIINGSMVITGYDLQMDYLIMYSRIEGVEMPNAYDEDIQQLFRQSLIKVFANTSEQSTVFTDILLYNGLGVTLNVEVAGSKPLIVLYTPREFAQLVKEARNESPDVAINLWIDNFKKSLPMEFMGLHIVNVELEQDNVTFIADNGGALWNILESVFSGDMSDENMSKLWYGLMFEDIEVYYNKPANNVWCMATRNSGRGIKLNLLSSHGGLHGYITNNDLTRMFESDFAWHTEIKKKLPLDIDGMIINQRLVGNEEISYNIQNGDELMTEADLAGYKLDEDGSKEFLKHMCEAYFDPSNEDHGVIHPLDFNYALKTGRGVELTISTSEGNIDTKLTYDELKAIAGSTAR